MHAMHVRISKLSAAYVGHESLFVFIHVYVDTISARKLAV